MEPANNKPVVKSSNTFDYAQGSPHEITPFNSYLRCVEIFKRLNKLQSFIFNPATSFGIQRVFRLMMSDSASSEIDYQLVCSERGCINSDGDWQLPVLKEIRVGKFRNLDESKYCADHSHSINSPPNEKILGKLFNIAGKKLNLPWQYSAKCCQGNTYYLYKVFNGMGIHSDWMNIHYCFRDLKSNHERSFHTGLSIMDENGNKWIIDPSCANKPLQLNEWSQKIFGSQFQCSVNSFPFKMKGDGSNYFFKVKGDQLLSFKNWEEDTCTVHLESPVKSIRPFAKSFAECMIKGNILSEVLISPPIASYLCQEAVVIKIQRFVDKSLILAPLPEEIRMMSEGYLSFNLDELKSLKEEYEKKNKVKKNGSKESELKESEREENRKIYKQKIHILGTDTREKHISIISNLKTCIELMKERKYPEKDIQEVSEAITAASKKMLSQHEEIMRIVWEEEGKLNRINTELC